MFVDFKGSVLGVISWQWKPLTLYGFNALAVVLMHEVVGWKVFELMPMPIAIVGGAIGIFVSFRTNSAYDRWWEGRKLWGALINVSRHFTTQSLTYVGTRGTEGAELAKRLIRRHIAYVHVLRALLRSQAPLDDKDALEFLTSDEALALQGDSNMTHALLQWQAEDLVRFSDAGELEPRRLQSMDESIRAILDVQGGCERIKKTPMPRGYAYFADLLIRIFSLLLPLGIVANLGWVAIPISLLVCFAFTMIGEVGRVLEDPFTLFWPALPLMALTKTIEVNLRHRMGETDVPAIPGPVNGVLM